MKSHRRRAKLGIAAFVPPNPGHGGREDYPRRDLNVPGETREVVRQSSVARFQKMMGWK